VSPFRTMVNVVQVFAASAALAFVVLLFVNEPDGSDSPSTDAGEASDQPDGAAIFAESCARCHGTDGGGGVGPQLSEMEIRFPNIEDQIAVVTNGRGGMPAFGGQLSDEAIRAVVEYTRTL
jgi:cytochrome c551